MSTAEKDEILSNIRVVIGLIRWLGGASFVAFMGLICLVVADHYDQADLRRDMDVLKPRVEQLWYGAVQRPAQHPSAVIKPPSPDA